jgi:putative transposase
MSCRSGVQVAVLARPTSSQELWENPFVESFIGRLRDESLNIELFTTEQEARLLAEQHRIEYNTYRPHSALQGRTSLEVLQQWRAA